MQEATQMTATKCLVLTAVNIALCLVLPMAFHSIPNGGKIMLPMHIPVLLCGMVCGAPYGAVCGLLGPLLSSILTSMPTAALMPAMMVECAAYGLTTGLMLRLVRTGKTYADLYLSLVAAMLVGRLVSGVTKALFFHGRTVYHAGMDRRELRDGAAGHRAPARRRAEHRLLSHARGTNPAALPEMRKEPREDRRLPPFSSAADGRPASACQTGGAAGRQGS